MDQLKKMKQCEVEASSNRGSPEKVRESHGVDSCRWESPPGKQPTPSQRRDEDSNCGSDPHSPKVVQLNRKSSLVGAQIADEDEALFLRRQSSMSSMFSEKMRTSSGALPSPSKRSVEQPKSASSSSGSRKHSGLMHTLSPGKRIEQPNESNVGILQETPAALMSSPGSRNHSGLLPSDSPDLTATGFDHPQPRGHTLSPVNAGGCSRLPSGDLYPCANLGGSPNSCLLNAAHFTFDNSTPAPNLAGAGGGNNNLTERLFKKLMGQSRLNRSNSKSTSGGCNESKSPVSTLDCPKSPTTSGRSFRGKSKRKSLRSRVEDANTVAAANPRPKSQLAQYLRSITASERDLATDDDNLEGPSEVAWLDPDSPYHSDRADRSYASTPGRNSKKKSMLESWSSNSSTWNLSLVQNPLRTVSTIVSRRHHQHASTPGRSVRKASRLGEPRRDAITRISLTGSYDGSYSARSRSTVRKGTASEWSSGRSWWSEIGSGRKSTSIWTCSGRLQMEVSAEPDLLEPDMAKAANNAVKNRAHQQVEDRAKVNEAAFPFNNPVASSFVFQEAADKSQSSTPDAASRVLAERTTSAMHKAAVVSVTDSENDSDLHFGGDIYHDPEDASVTNSEASSHWNSIRQHSFDYVREVAVGSSGLSSRALSRLLLIERSGMEITHGRFSVDLQRGQKLDKALHPRTPDPRLRVFASEKSSKRSILSPCLPFLQRSPYNKPEIQQAPVAPSSRKLQSMSSFTARLGPVTETASVASPIYVQ